MTRDVLLRRVRFYFVRTLLAVLSAYTGSVVCWMVTVLCSPLDTNAHPATVLRSIPFLLLSAALALVFGNTGLLLFLCLANAMRSLLTWWQKVFFLAGSTLAGFLGVLLGPMPALWRFPKERLNPEDWRFHLLGTSIGLVSGCVFLLLTHRAESRIQRTS